MIITNENNKFLEVNSETISFIVPLIPTIVSDNISLDTCLVLSCYYSPSVASCLSKSKDRKSSFLCIDFHKNQFKYVSFSGILSGFNTSRYLQVGDTVTLDLMIEPDSPFELSQKKHNVLKSYMLKRKYKDISTIKIIRKEGD